MAIQIPGMWISAFRYEGTEVTDLVFDEPRKDKAPGVSNSRSRKVILDPARFQRALIVLSSIYDEMEDVMSLIDKGLTTARQQGFEEGVASVKKKKSAKKKTRR